MAAALVLSGELGLLSLFDLGQLFMLNGATGELALTRDGRRGYFYFDRGQIVNAVDEEYHEGEGAAYRLFTWRTGTFEFRAEPPSGARTINESTEGLMLEAARRLDESGTEPGGSSATDRLRQRASALDAIREVFQSVASETAGAADSEAGGGATFAALRDPADALLFRPGHVPRVLHAGRWRDAGGAALDPASFDQLRAKLLDGVWPPSGTTARSPGVSTNLITHEDGRRYAITRVGGAHEALWVRAAELSPGELADLDGPLEHLHGLLAAPSGLVLVGGADADTADRLFHHCVAALARHRGATALLVADHGRWRHLEDTGALVRSNAADAPELLRALAPRVAAFDCANAGLSFDALHTAPLVVAALVAPEAGAMLARWCVRIGRRWNEGPESLLAGGIVGALHGVPGADGRVTFVATRLRTRAEDDASPAGGSTPAAVPAAARTDVAGTLQAPDDPMAALAAELARTLRKAA